MKLRLPLLLAAAVMAVFSNSARAAEYTWTGAAGSDVHIEGNWTPGFGGQTWTQIWANTTSANSMVFSSTVVTTNKAANFSFTPICLAGIRVETGATGYSLVYNFPGGTAFRNMELRAATDASSVLFSISEDFTVGVSSYDTLRFKAYANVNFDVATGKALHLYGHMANGTDENAYTYTIGSQAGYGGTVNIYYAADAGFNQAWVISNGATLNDKTGGALGTGSITMSSGTRLIVEGNKTYTMGTLIGQGNVVLIGADAEVTMAGSNGNFTGSLDFDGKKLILGSAGVANGTLNLTNAAGTELGFNSAGADTANGTIAFAGPATINVAQQSGKVTLNGSMSTTALTKTGLGEFVLNKTQSFTGGLTLKEGALTLDFASVTNNLVSESNALIFSSGELKLVSAGGNHSQSFSGTLFTGGTSSFLTLDASSGGIFTFNFGAITGTGSLVVTTAGQFVLTSSTYMTPGQVIDSITFSTPSGFQTAVVDIDGHIVAGTSLANLPASGADPNTDYQLLGSLTVLETEGAKTLSLGNDLSSPDLVDNTLTITDGKILTVNGKLVFVGARDYLVTGGSIVMGELKTSGAGTLEIASTATINGNVEILGSGVLFSPIAGQTSIIKGEVSGTGTLRKAGEGVLDLQGSIAAGVQLSLEQGLLTFSSGALVNNPTILFKGGTLKYKTGVTDDISASLAGASGFIPKVDLNGNTVAWGSIKNGYSYEILDTGATKGTLTITNPANVAVSLKLTDSRVVWTASGGRTLNEISGNGELTAKHTGGNLIISKVSGFTGKLIIDSTTTAYTVLAGPNTADTRFDLEINTTAATHSVILNETFDNKVIYLRNLSGTGCIRMDWNEPSASPRSINVEQTHDNTWSGYIPSSGNRNGNMTIGSATGQNYTFTMMGYNSTVANRNLTISNATVNMAGDGSGNNNRGFWAGAIGIGAQGTLKISRSDSGANAFAHSGVISGAGKVVMDGTGKATLSGANTYEGGTSVLNGTLVAGSATAFGVGTVTVNGGTLDLNSQIIGNAVTIKSGRLSNMSADQGTSLFSVAATGNASLSGISTAKIDGMAAFGTAGVDGRITDVGGSIVTTSSTLTVGSGSIGSSGEFIVSFTDTASNWVVDSLTLDFTNLIDYFTGGEYEITVTNGVLAGGILDDDYRNITLLFSNPDQETYLVDRIEGGVIYLKRDGSTLLEILMGDTQTYTQANALDKYTGVLLEGTMNIQLAAAGTINVKELRGAESTAIMDTNGTANGTIVALDMSDDSRTYAGSISGPADIAKTGEKDLTIGGDVDLTGAFAGGATGTGSLNITGGLLSINGDLTANNITTSTTAKGLILGAGSDNTVSGTVTLANGTTLTLGSGSTTSIQKLASLASNTGGIIIASDASLSLTEGGDIYNAITLQNGSGAGTGTGLDVLAGAAFKGTVTVGNDAWLDMAGSASFAENLSIGEGSTVDIAGDATFAKNVVMQSDAVMELGDDASFNGTLTLGDDAELTVEGIAGFTGAVSTGEGSLMDLNGASTFGNTVSLGADSTLDLGAGTTFNGTLTAAAGSSVTAANGAAFNGAVTLAGSSMELNGAASTFAAGLDMQANSSLTTSKAVTVAGNVQLGQGAELTLATGGSWTQSSGSTTINGGSLSAGTGGVFSFSGTGLVFGSNAATFNFLMNTPGDNVQSYTVSGAWNTSGLGTAKIMLDIANTDTWWTAGDSYTLLLGTGLAAGTYSDIFDINLQLTQYQSCTITVNASGDLSFVISEQDVLKWYGDGSNWKVNDSNNWNGLTYINGSYVVFGDEGTVTQVNVEGNVAPGTMEITGSKNYTFSAANGGGAITGDMKLTKGGAGTATVNMANSYTGGTDINGGTIVAGVAGALGTEGDITFGGGTLKYAANFTGQYDIASRIKTKSGSNARIDINGNTLAWDSNLAAGNRYEIMDTGGTKGSLTMTQEGAGNAGDMPSLILNASTVKYQTTGTSGDAYMAALSATGASTFELIGGTADLVINSISGFGGGTMIKAAGNTNYLVINGANTSSSRIALKINSSAGEMGVILGSGLSSNTLYLNSLGGSGDIRADWGEGTSRSIDLLMTADNTWSGGFINGSQGTRAGNMTIDSSGATRTFNMAGASSVPAASSLLIKNAVVNMSGTAGFWSGAIDIAQQGSLVISRSDTAFNHTSVISGAGGITMSGTGKATLAGANTYSGATSIESGTLAVGNNKAFGNGTVTVKGGTLDFGGGSFNIANQVIVKNGSLTNMGTSQAGTAIKINAEGNVNLGGLTGAQIASLGEFKTVNDLGRITGMTGSVTWTGTNTPDLTLSKSCQVGAAEFSSALIQFTSTGTLTMDSMKLDLLSIYVTLLETGNYTFAITNGQLAGGILTRDSYDIYSNIELYSHDNSIHSQYFNVVDVAGGNVTITYRDSGTLFLVKEGEGRDVSEPGDIPSHITDVQIDGTLYVAMDDPDQTLVIKELRGQEEGIIDSNGTESGTVIELNTENDEGLYKGVITGPASLVKTGGETLAIGGEVDLSGTLADGSDGLGDLTVEEGTLALNGNLTAGDTEITGGELALGAGTVNSTGDIDISAGGALTLGNGAQTTVDGILTGDSGSEISMGQGAVMNLSGDNIIDSDVSGSGTFVVDDGSVRFLSDIDGNKVRLGTNGALDIGTDGDSTTVAGLSGGTVTGTGGALVLALSGDNYFDSGLDGSGTIVKQGGGVLEMGAGSQSADYSLDITEGTLLLRQPANGTASYNDVTMGDGTHLVLGCTNSPYWVTALHTAGTFSMGSGSSLDIYVTPTYTSSYITSDGGIDMGGGRVAINLHDNGDIDPLPSGDWTFTLASSAAGITGAGNLNITFAGYFANVFQDGVTYSLENNNQDLVVKAVRTGSNPFAAYAKTNNQQVGSNLMWNTTINYSPDKTGMMYQLGEALGNARLAGDSEGVSTTLSSISGSAFTAMLSAERSGLMNQVAMIRNQATKLGVDQNYINTDMPYFHAWITGNGAYDRLNADGDEAGFDLSTWGGTFGVDADFTDSLSMGIAFSALYGDLKSKSLDYSDGDRDAYYLSLYGRYQHKRWAHVFAVTGGWSDIKQDRTVNFVGGNSYRTSYDSSGTAFNAFYEGTYDVYLNDSKTSILQPLVSAAISYVKVSDFSETASHDATLRASGMDMTYGTFGVGARLIGDVGSNLFGRAAVGELRVEFLQDVGDVRSKANVGWINYPGYVGEVNGAKVGKSGVQMGAAIAIPVGEQGAVFGDANIDLRSKQTSVFGRVGYRYTF